jgi:hypothetical protein
LGYKSSRREIPTHGKIGKLIILLNKLFYKNILSLKYKSGHSIKYNSGNSKNLKNTKVSDAFVEIIMELYKIIMFLI